MHINKIQFHIFIFFGGIFDLTLTPLSLRRGVRAGAMGVRLLGGLNKLGAVGLRNGALGIPLRGAVMQILTNTSNSYTPVCNGKMLREHTLKSDDF